MSYYNTPQRYFPSPQQQHSTSSSRHGSAAAGGAPSFTPAMRDRQARGKDPYSPHDSNSDSDMDFDAVDSPSRSGGGGGGGVGRLGHLPGGGGGGGGSSGPGVVGGSSGAGGEGFEAQRQRKFAIEVLDDPEKLAMYACSRGDSIPGTRLYFTRILCGLDQESGAQQDHRKAASSRRDPRRKSAGGERAGRH